LGSDRVLNNGYRVVFGVAASAGVGVVVMIGGVIVGELLEGFWNVTVPGAWAFYAGVAGAILAFWGLMSLRTSEAAAATPIDASPRRPLEPPRCADCRKKVHADATVCPYCRGRFTGQQDYHLKLTTRSR
jgi:hypothetical protein